MSLADNLKRSFWVVWIYKIKFLIKAYHYSLAFLGALVYGFPSRRMRVIGVTGTKGKTTTCNLIAQIFNFSGYKTGMASTVNFRIGEEEWSNDAKQTMLGRFALQKLLKRMANEGCKYAVVETSSEGILQYRHRFINYRAAIFTNLSPEHIERHGGFESYRAAKIKLFEAVAKKEDGVGVFNLDDENVEFFLKTKIERKYGYSLKNDDGRLNLTRKFFIDNVKIDKKGSSFNFNAEKFETSLVGEFNVYNVAAAIVVAVTQGIDLQKIREGLKQAKAPAGRMEVVIQKPFWVVVDYAYEPKSLESALQTVGVFKPKRVITLVGSAGGGRDRWRRPVMGEVADELADVVLVTTDDPYDEDPEKIVDEVLVGVLKNKKRVLGENVFRVVDRKEAIYEALKMAKEGDLVFIPGKGGELWMNVADGKKIPWSDVEIVREVLKSRKTTSF
ncbi:MAG: UDP-N-acetylmuramyl-tripeptide synthetase [Candidatus Liptonbacteria bacterium]|nr:UDP-N-acetylmuramyl-tripeptide synthetase [Candidatus Liptonbacteria bacterium]